MPLASRLDLKEGQHFPSFELPSPMVLRYEPENKHTKYIFYWQHFKTVATSKGQLSCWGQTKGLKVVISANFCGFIPNK